MTASPGAGRDSLLAVETELLGVDVDLRAVVVEREVGHTVGCKSFPGFIGPPGESPVKSYNRPYQARADDARDE